MDTKALASEFIGTFTLVSAICSAIPFAPAHSSAIIVSIVAGLALLAMTNALIDVSGAHFNPAVTLGLVAGGRFEPKDATGYIIAQVLGALTAAALVTFLIGAGNASPAQNTATLANSFGTTANTTLLVTGITEIVLTALFLIVFMGATSNQTDQFMPAIAIGLGFAAFHLIATPLSTGSMNPARSTGPALFAGTSALTQLWLFWVAPIIGGIIGGLTAKWLHDE